MSALLEGFNFSSKATAGRFLAGSALFFPFWLKTFWLVEFDFCFSEKLYFSVAVCIPNNAFLLVVNIFCGGEKRTLPNWLSQLG